MVSFLHSADWQLGLKLHFVPGDRGARLRLQRFETVARIAALAKERQVDAVLVAGDVFDDNEVGGDTLQRTRDVLRAFAPIPLLLLPGNHDPANADGALQRLDLTRFSDLAHVHLLLDESPLRLGALHVYPAPLRRRSGIEDPTRPLRELSLDRAAVNVAMAHGSVLDFSTSERAMDRIDGARLVDKGYDYVALGDWHGTLSFGPRLWYSGTPEATRFKERDPGNVLHVRIAGPGQMPEVERLSVARSRWLQRKEILQNREEVEALLRWLDALPERSWTLVELELEGALSLADRALLDRGLQTQAEELLCLRLRDEELRTAPAPEDLQPFEQEGFLSRVAQQLARGESEAERDGLRLLHRLWLERSP
mgnify:CR=1 FL=1